MESNFKRELILENFENPVGKGLKNDSSYKKINQSNYVALRIK